MCGESAGLRSGQRVPLGPANAWVVLFCATPRSADPLRPHLVVAVSHAPSAQPLHADLDAEQLPGHLIDDALHPRPQTGSLAVVVKDERCGRDLSWAGGRAGQGRGGEGKMAAYAKRRRDPWGRRLHGCKSRQRSPVLLSMQRYFVTAPSAPPHTVFLDHPVLDHPIRSPAAFCSSAEGHSQLPSVLPQGPSPARTSSTMNTGGTKPGSSRYRCRLFRLLQMSSPQMRWRDGDICNNHTLIKNWCVTVG